MISAETLPELFEKAAATYGDKTAYIWRPGFRALKYSFSDIGKMSRQAAHLLEQYGVQQGDRVVIWALNSPFWVAVFQGCQLIGAVAVPLMVQNTRDFVKLIVEFTDARLLLKSSHMKSADITIPVVNIEDALMQGNLPEAYSKAEVVATDLAQILFTSGTTGTPKGVMHKHSNLLANVRDIYRLNILRRDDHLMSYLPLAHVFEQILSLYACSGAGVTVTQASSLSGLHIRLCMVEDRPTIMTSVPEFLRLTVERIEVKAEKAGLLGKIQMLYRLAPRLPAWMRRFIAKPILTRLGSRMRLIVVGGSALEPDIGNKWEAFGIIILQGYGATETSPVISVNRLHGRKTESVGLPLPSVRIQIAGDGEIAVSGPNVTDGYYKRPEETAEHFRDGWYYTDDLGEIDSEGHLHIKGRKKFLIVTPAGENVYPEDVENELQKEPEVKSAVVLAWKPGGRFEIHAVLLPKPGESIVCADPIIERVNQRLQPHQRIQGVSIWDSDDFPRTVTRKVKKSDVLAWLEASMGRGTVAKVLVPAGSVERAIAQAAGIPSDQIAPENRLESDLKLDSLGRVALAGILEEELSVFVDEGQLQPTTTVAEIKALVELRQQKEERYEFNEAPLTHKAVFWRSFWQKILVWPFLRTFAQISVRGYANVKCITEPVMFCPNHISPIDAAIILKTLPTRFQARTAVAAASDVVYENPVVKAYTKHLETLFNIFPFSRETQVKSSLEYTGRLLDRGFSILLFPEGHMAREGKLQPVKLGAGLIAVQMGVQVVPIGVVGVDKMVPADAESIMMPHRAKAAVVFGKPISFKPSTPIHEAAEQIHAALATLLPKEMLNDGVAVES